MQQTAKNLVEVVYELQKCRCNLSQKYEKVFGFVRGRPRDWCEATLAVCDWRFVVYAKPPIRFVVYNLALNIHWLSAI